MKSADFKLPLIDLEDRDRSTGRKQEQSVQRERLSGGDIYCVYWIRLQNHTDINTQGYVGITINFDERLRGHKKNNRRSHFTSAISKYGWDNLVKEVIHDDTNQENALRFEAQYRPTENIGWNSQRGGELGVDRNWYEIEANKEQHSKATSEATRIGIALKDTTEARSERGKQNWIKNRMSYEGRCTGSKNPNARLTEEQVFEIKYNLIPQGLSNKEIARRFPGVKAHMISFIRVGRTWKHV